MPNPLKEYEEARRLLVRGIAAAKAKEYEEANRYLDWVLRIPSTSDQKADAHFWLSVISKEKSKRLDHLKLAISHNSAHHRARKQLAILEGKLDLNQMVDPDDYRQTVPDGPVNALGDRFVCSQCGGRMTYVPDGESLTCEYCDVARAEQYDTQLEETDFVIGISTALGRNKAVATLSFECKACGAIYLLSPETLSLTCPHCNSAYSIKDSETRQLIPPEGIIPFKSSAADAIKAARSWVRKTYDLHKKTPHLSRFTGIYLPAWTFDIGGYVRWRGRIYEEDSFLDVSGKEVINYDDLFAAACSSPPRFFKELLAQFRATDVQPFNPDYTANWLAETYNVTMSDAALEARLTAFNDAKQRLTRKEDLKRISNLTFTSDEIVLASFKLVLVPVWVGDARFNGQVIDLIINGSNSTVFGPTPPGKLKKLVNWFLG